MTPQELLSAGRLAEALGALQDTVRKDASNARHRVFLFQLLCVLGEWKRALNQLNVAGELDPSTLAMVQTYREAIQCEALRGEIFAGTRLPLVFGEPPAWLALLFEALKADAAGDAPRAAAARARAFEDAPAVAGSIDGERFAWLADADATLGPVLEAIVNGRYFWVPLAHVRRIEIDPPGDLRDTVWMPASFTWANGAQTVGLIPTRYAATLVHADAAGPAGSGADGGSDALLLARRTDWIEAGPHAGRGIGQRMFATDAGEYALMDVRVIDFDAPGEADG